MAEPFKNWINPTSIRGLATDIAPHHDDFDVDAFVAEACEGLESRELKARVARVSEVLRAHLPSAWSDALRIVVASLPPPMPDTTELKSGFTLWPLLHLVEVYGLADPERSLDSLPELTRRFTAEFAIRPYLDQHPELAWPRVRAWTRHPDVHVRRLCSEGSRPRLPWGMQLKASITDPSRGLSVLHALVDDAEPYVRTSVGNHLNDISKDHPELAVQTARGWLEQPTEGRRWIVRRGLRTLIKKGHAGALELLGFGPPRATLQALSVAPDPVTIGSATTLTATLVPEQDQDWLIDWIVRAPRADGSLGHRVLKGKTRTARAGRAETVSGRLSLKRVTTRVTRPGRWQVAVQVNGQILGEVGFDVVGEAG